MADKPKVEFMPTREQINETDFQLAQEIVADEKMVSDFTGVTNKVKWDRVKEVFGVGNKTTLFSTIDYNDIWIRDEHRTAEAASFVADLRTQWLNKMLSTHPESPYLHQMYLQNYQWYVRLRERVKLYAQGELLKRHTKLN